jgi:hypothetical protein
MALNFKYNGRIGALNCSLSQNELTITTHIKNVSCGKEIFNFIINKNFDLELIKTMILPDCSPGFITEVLSISNTYKIMQKLDKYSVSKSIYKLKLSQNKFKEFITKNSVFEKDAILSDYCDYIRLRLSEMENENISFEE